jgi:hypothetical protein
MGKKRVDALKRTRKNRVERNRGVKYLESLLLATNKNEDCELTEKIVDRAVLWMMVFIRIGRSTGTCLTKEKSAITPMDSRIEQNITRIANSPHPERVRKRDNG